ncbi:MAG: TetR/AcrR family transcriptional regulator [Alphaproteobacteria bacterium]|nr:TetR/AcrR family transcriptional regulator [Alphaproteobacteria bacterium]
MARPREFDRDQVVDHAIELFWRKGYTAASIQDLVAATGLNRGSLYATFGDKAGLFAAAVDRYMAAGNVQRLFDSADERPFVAVLRDVLQGLVDAGAADPHRKGCLLTNTVVELGPHDRAVAESLAGHLAELEASLARRIRAAQKAGELSSDRPPRALARFVVSSIQGLRVMSKLRPERRYLEDIAGEVLARFERPGEEGRSAGPRLTKRKAERR